jgi:heat shock protein HslJ
MIRQSRGNLSGLLLAAFLAACAGNKGADGAGDTSASVGATPDVTTPVSMLQAGEWQVDQIEGTPLVDGSRITLTFGADSRVGGRACNSYGGEYELRGDTMTISETISTKMACSPPAVMEQESRYLGALSRVTRFGVGSDGALELHTATGVIRARR